MKTFTEWYADRYGPYPGVAVESWTDIRDQQIAQMTQAMHVKGLVETRACNCVGPQDGQPLCPCRMRGVEIEDGRYVMPARDLGPVR